jgi:hypothetical protein
LLRRGMEKATALTGVAQQDERLGVDIASFTGWPTGRTLSLGSAKLPPGLVPELECHELAAAFTR